MFQVVGAGFGHNGKGIGRELGEGEEGLLSGVNIPAVGHAYGTDGKRCGHGAGQDAGRPGTKSQKAQVLQCIFHIILCQSGNDGTALGIKNIGAFVLFGHLFHFVLKFIPSFCNIRNEIDFKGKGQIICCHT